MNARPGLDVSSNQPRHEGFIEAPHHTFAYAAKTKDDYYEFRNLITSSSDTVPIFSINYAGMRVKDPVMEALRERRKLEAEKRRLKNRVQREKLRPGQISEDMVKYIELSETDPDPLMGTEFDWRTLGGNLGVLELEQGSFFAQPSMCRDYDIRLVKRKPTFEYMNLPFNPKELNKNYGYELLTYRPFIGIRRKNQFILKNTGEIDRLCIKAPIEFKWAFDIAGCHMRSGYIIFIDVNQKLHRIALHGDFEVEAIVKLPEVERKHQFPVSVNSFDLNVVTYTNQKELKLVDFRSGRGDTLFREENFVMKCEELSYHTRSARKNLLYLASSHLLYGIDRRMPRKILMHWNHQMVMKPTMIKTTVSNTEEVICLASSKPGDLRIFNCQDPTMAQGINWLPHKPRSIRESYDTLRGKGELLLSETIKHRVDLSVTGVALITVRGRKKAKVELYTQNSIGDIYKTDLFPKNNQPLEKLDVSRHFHQWDIATKINHDALKFASTKELVNHGDLRFTDIVNLKGLSSVLRCERLQRNGEETDYGKMETKKKPRWRVDVEKAKEYIDVLAQPILSEWELEIEELQPSAFAEALQATQNLNESGVDKVSWWLDAPGIVAEEMEVDELLAEPVSQLPETQQSAVKKQKKPSQRIKGF